MMSKIVAISGKKGSGKDLVLDIIRYLNEKGEWDSFAEFEANKSPVYNDWENKKFADKLKDMTCLLLGCTRDQLEDRDYKESPLGEEWDRYLVKHNVGDIDLIYENAYFGTLKEALSFYEEDKEMRCFPELVKMTPRLILQLLGTEGMRNTLHPNVHVNALFADLEEDSMWVITDCRFPNEVKAVEDKGGIVIRLERPGVDTSDEHPSETALDDHDFEFVVHNDGTKEDLIKKIKDIVVVYYGAVTI